MIRPKPAAPSAKKMLRSVEFVPKFALRKHTEAQLHALKFADSITIDPHKSGYIPYPAGALCYRDERMRYLITWTAPYLSDGKTADSIGVFGIEGRRVDAAVAVESLFHAKDCSQQTRGAGGRHVLPPPSRWTA